jgi:uncharacterized membrane protein
MTAVTIAACTITDAWRARASGDAVAYAAALFVAEGVVFTLVALWMLGASGLAALVGFVVPGLAGGAMAAGSYAVAIRAMPHAPVPLIAALRETSVLFGAALGIFILKGPLQTHRLVAVALILFGLMAIRLA